MEAHLTGAASDQLLERLRVKPPSNPANYGLASRQVQYVAESGNRFDPVSSRAIRVGSAGQGLLEASSVRLKFTLTNLKGEDLTPCAAAPSMFRRARLFVSSQLVEDITELATQAQLQTRLLPADRTSTDSIDGHPLQSAFTDTYEKMTGNTARRLITPLPGGVLTHPRWIATHLCAGAL